MEDSQFQRKLTKKPLFKFIAAGISVVVCAAAAAQKGPENRTWGLLGIEGSYNTLTSSIASESNKKGPGFGAKGVLSTYFDRAILDGSAGWHMSTIKGTAGTKETKIDTQSGLLQGDFRYTIAPNFSVGPTAQLFFGTDQSYAEIVNVERNWAAFGGVHVNYDIPYDDFMMRIGSKAVMDVSVSDRRVYAVFLDLQMGIPLFEGGRPAKKVEEQPTPLALEEIPPVAFQDIPSPRAEVQNLGNRRMLVRLPSDQFLFDTGMSHLKKASQLYLADLGRYLGQTTDNYSRIEVTGHTDNRGTRRINMQLSRSRARTVHDLLVESGTPAQKITSKGRAFDDPVDSRNMASAWAKNRRTDLVFRGVVNPADIEAKVEELNDRYGRGEYNR